CRGNRNSRRVKTRPTRLRLPLPLPLILLFGAPPERRRRRTRPRRGAAHGCAAVSARASMPSRKIPPAPRTRCAAPGAQAGCAFFALGFFAQATTDGSRRPRPDGLHLDVGGTGTAGGSRPALRGF